MNHRGWPSLRIASAVCSKCSICVKSVSGSLSSTSVFRYLRHFPNALFCAGQAAIFRFFLQHKIVGLLGVIFSVELGDAGIRVSFVIAKFFFGFSLTIASGDEIVPLFELLHRSVFGYATHGNSPLNPWSKHMSQLWFRAK